tara:strand:+ start:223 stop:513 length:291 start_codon:yes stop_codon:yes gene_type:complete
MTKNPIDKKDLDVAANLQIGRIQLLAHEGTFMELLLIDLRNYLDCCEEVCFDDDDLHEVEILAYFTQPLSEHDIEEGICLNIRVDFIIHVFNQEGV